MTQGEATQKHDHHLYHMPTQQRYAICDQTIVDADDIGRLDPQQIRQQRLREYHCQCPEKHRVTFVHLQHPQWSTRGTFRHAFGHGGKGGCAESEEHYKAKYLLQKHVGKYEFLKDRCISCGIGTFIRGENAHVVVEERVTVSGKQYVYDCVLKREPFPDCVMEVLHTHETTLDKEREVRASGCNFAEFRVSEVIEKLEKLDEGTKFAGFLYNLRTPLFRCQQCREEERDYQRWNEERLERDRKGMRRREIDDWVEECAPFYATRASKFAEFDAVQDAAVASGRGWDSRFPLAIPVPDYPEQGFC